MSDDSKVNIGTKEKPIWVPPKALAPGSPEGKEWWEMIATGSVVLESHVLDQLLEVSNIAKSEG